MDKNQLLVERSLRPKKSNKGARIFLVILLVLIAACGVGFSVYVWNQSQSKQVSITSKDKEIQSLNSQLASLKSSASNVNTTQTNEDVISIRELGISITVPDSIKDLTYSYMPVVNQNGKFETVRFSTKSITDQNATDNSATNYCASYGDGPLGALEKWSGVYDPKNSHIVLAKQLNGFYISYDSPQSACVKNYQPNLPNPFATQIKAFQSSLTSIKVL